MQEPLKLQIRGVKASAHLREILATNIAKLERRYGRITTCEVNIKRPDRHHRMGEPYAVSVRLALPNRRDVNVSPPPRGIDRRHGEIVFAVNDAFRRADRQLRNHASRLRGESKVHAETPAGRIARLERNSEFGFIATDDGREIYFHAHSVLDGKFRRLRVGSRVTFHEEAGEQGPQASTVRVLTKQQA